MRVPLRWLREYVPFDGSVVELAELLSMSGSEVEAVDWVGAPRDPDNLARFVVGRVLTRAQHPNADKLSLCTVEVGEGRGSVRQIVCGADNFEAGEVVAVSLVGAVLENGLKLRRSAIRGVESDGMMLSEKELGYELESPGIVVLPSDWTVGAPLQEYLPVAEAVLEIEVTPNRPDCLSVYGIAREVAAVTGLSLSPPPIAEPPVSGAPARDDVVVRVVDADLCPRYGARVIRGVQVGESPVWLKARLTHAGMRPINNVVDVTNYAMLAWGQPLHAFDLEKIEGRTLVVRRAAASEPIITLDGVTRTLSDDTLVIADVRRPLVIAGVFGSVDAEVDATTTQLVLEAATFSGPNIMRTEHRTGIRSEASSRFEKGLDAELVSGGLAMASRLLAGLCGGTVAPGTVDVRAGAPAPAPLRYRPAKCDALLGLHVPVAEQAAILRRLECEVAGSGDVIAVSPPSFRTDLEREVDLIEEVGRIHGLERVPETLPRRREALGALKPDQKLRRAARAALIGGGLDEVVTYAFIGREQLAWLGLREGDVRAAPVALANPMSAEQSVMRTTLLPSVLGAVRENLARLNDPLRLFEIGRVYLWDERRTAAGAHAGGYELPHEMEALAVALHGPVLDDDWLGSGRQTDFYTIKGVVERLLSSLGAPEVAILPWTTLGGADGVVGEPEPYLHPGKSAALVLGPGRVGALGLLRPDVTASFGIEEGEVYVAELSLEGLTEHAFRPRLFTDLVTYPPASQDLAIVVDDNVAAADVVAAVGKAGGKLLHSVSVFDVYHGDQVPSGKHSLALRLVMRSPERTLTEKDITTVRQRVLAALEREFGAALR